ncbi:GNAT family N-acetyltransferase [Nocardioides seonyuensis]|uniref:GNAT family N-acetyltransferase n=1 Tax=Nocardioides seonyuensis TaxID=2518371 RepID=A0A4P7IJD0_9ACTN|nr:GNAT family N-acetyltransferase [Nocardioides seonyuensis]QBX55991.1 GNAT family N-acetyltransferase [Nocardioides seonyuensis]
MELTIERVALTHPEVTPLVEAVQGFYVERYGTPDEAPIDPTEFEDPVGQFYLGRLDGRPVATGAWRRSTVVALGGGRSAEVKRMYVAPAAQGLGVARRMLAHIEETAAAAGIDVLVLETGLRQHEAISLYASSGFEPIPGFGYYRGSELSRCFGKRLS